MKNKPQDSTGAQSASLADGPVPETAVSSFNEWDPLEEVIVGVADNACVPIWHVSLKATMPESQWAFFSSHGGRPFPRELVDAARRDLDGFVQLLESEGVVVRRPDALDFTRPFATPDWNSPGGLYAAMPRDLLLVLGHEIIEAPLSWRCRYHEIDAYRPLLWEYFRRGATWTAAPRPLLRDDLYREDYEEPTGDQVQPVIHDLEPTFDAADFIRCGRDIFVQRSHVTNNFGIRWLARHLGSAYRIHEVAICDQHPMHIDATLMPLAPGKLLVNPQRIREVPAPFLSWEVRHAPCPSWAGDFIFSSSWISMNVLMLDERRVVVEAHEGELISLLRRWGFEPIPCNFRNFNVLGGAFHCATLDIRRRGELQSYF